MEINESNCCKRWLSLMEIVVKSGRNKRNWCKRWVIMREIDVKGGK